MLYKLYKLCWFGALRFSLEISKHRIASSKSEYFGNFGNIALPFLQWFFMHLKFWNLSGLGKK